jgi:hypothetical protein
MIRLVVPWFVGITGFHGRNDMNQAGMITPLLENGELCEPLRYAAGATQRGKLRPARLYKTVYFS